MRPKRRVASDGKRASEPTKKIFFFKIKTNTFDTLCKYTQNSTDLPQSGGGSQHRQ
ncbi:MAG: hypothetical protein [Arizlama microvirus]|nr:MAG: hypothetical protein [Arizlama microvirus]